jgi:transposase
MINQFIPVERDQPFVIPVQEWLAEDHLARFVVTILSGLDVSTLEASYSGSAPYPSRMMLAFLFYGYATGIFSSRKLEQARYELIPVIYITVHGFLIKN